MKRTANLIKFELTKNELWYLFSLYGPMNFYGISNPRLGMLNFEIEFLDKMALASLEGRGILASKGNNIEIDIIAKGLVEGCRNSERVLIVSHIKDNSEQKRITYCLYKKIGLKITFTDQLNDTIQISLLPGLFIDENDLKEWHWENSHSISKNSPIIIAQKDFFIIQDYIKINKIDDARKYIKKYKIKTPDGENLLQDIREKSISRFLITAVKNPNIPGKVETETFHIIDGKETLWMIHPIFKNGKNLIIFNPTNNTEVLEEVKFLLA